MTEFVIDARVLRDAANGLHLDLMDTEGRHLALTMPPGLTIEEAAQFVLDYAFEDPPDRSPQRRYVVMAHKETLPPQPDGGPLGGERWVVDSVEVRQLPDEVAREGFAALPGWATWSAAEAAAWIDANVVSLATAKVALSAMARAICYLRDWRA